MNLLLRFSKNAEIVLKRKPLFVVESRKSKVVLRLATCVLRLATWDLQLRGARELVGVTGVEPVTFTLSV